MRSLIEHSWIDKSDLLYNPMEFFLKMVGGSRNKSQGVPQDEGKSAPAGGNAEGDHREMDPKDEISLLKKQLMELEKKLTAKERR